MIRYDLFARVHRTVLRYNIEYMHNVKSKLYVESKMIKDGATVTLSLLIHQVLVVDL
jgi:hypothetical protein